MLPEKPADSDAETVKTVWFSMVHELDDEAGAPRTKFIGTQEQIDTEVERLEQENPGYRAHIRKSEFGD